MNIGKLIKILDREAQELRVHTFNRKQIARLFQVPEHMLGTSTFYRPSAYESLAASLSCELAKLLDKDLRRIAKPKGQKKRARK